MAADKREGLDIGSILQGVGSIAGLFGDRTTVNKGGTTTATSTTGLDITQEGINKMLKDILGGAGGLAAVSSGQRSSGMYNSTVNQQLTNDLMDRATGTVAAKTAKQTTTQTTTTPTTTSTVQGQFGLGDAALGLGAAMGAKKLYDIIGSAAAPAATAATAGAATGALASSMGDIIGTNFTGAGIDFLGTGGNAVLGSMSPFIGGAGKLLEGDVGGAVVDTGLMLGANAVIPGLGPVMAAVNSVLPIGDIVSDIGSAIGGILGSVVCTELFMQGKMDSKLYLTDIAYAKAHMSARTLNGYRSWGIPLVRLMRKSKVITSVAGFFAINRAHYISKLMGKKHNKYKAMAGAIINAVGVPICYAIGYCLEKLDAVKHLTVATSSIFVRG